MAVASRAAELLNMDFFFASPLPKKARHSKIPEKLIDFAFGACIEIAKRSATSEPHFIWEDNDSVTISPSEFQFQSLIWCDGDFVTIEEEDLPWRSYCLEAVNALERYELLEAGWDGEDAPSPASSSLHDGHLFLRLVSSEIDSAPNVIPAIDHEGIPSFIFDNGKSYLSISFYGEGSVTAYTIDRETRKNSVCTFTFDDVDKLEATLKLIESL